MNKPILVLVTSAAALAILAGISTPAPPSKEKAHSVLTGCVEKEAKGCYFEQDGTRRADVQGRTFAVVTVEDEPRLAVANYHFATKEGEYCAFVQFLKDQTWWTAEFYRCANRSRVHLGVG